MTAPFASLLLGWRASGVPNVADSDSEQSKVLARAMLRHLAVPTAQAPGEGEAGKLLEMAVRNDLETQLLQAKPDRQWIVQRGVKARQFAQYRHLNALDDLVKSNPELRITIGTDYLVKPDVTVGIPCDSPLTDGFPVLHAAISCKWTIRSDRVQNTRHEFNGLIRHRRGRQPHLVVVTAEPLPSRIVAIARGTGEIDAVYHIAYDALDRAVRDVGNIGQQGDWEECTKQRRVLPYEQLVMTLAKW
ncbi:NgoMIV family type II restriction endonuclease [Streptomyces sp. CoH27]|uniref:NgoMIV family type II restriction endonuclease n=1 Tax=Streptomyces sp. CoH27 TaxID=2875763 RepID=UPI001CD53797|nr:NgoMIV family type II restriction endonuclease [Streptomyces sp. CoH27]